MAKAQGKLSQVKKTELDSPVQEPVAPKKSKDKDKDKDKERKNSDEDVLIGQVKKVIKKSRRKLSEEKFEKQLRRTIAFLEDLQSKLAGTAVSVTGPPKRKRSKTAKKSKPKAAGKKKKPVAASVKQALTAAKLDE